MWTRTDGPRPVVVAALTTAGIVAFSVVPVPIARRGFGTYGPDKWPHVLSHAVLAVAVADCGAPDRPRARAAVVGAAVSTALGAVIERLQDAVPWRTGEDADVAAGAVGALLGAGLWLGSRTGGNAVDDCGFPRPGNQPHR